MSGTRCTGSNSTIRWIGVVLVLLSMIVGTVMYVADVRADIDQNSRDVAKLQEVQAEVLKVLHKIERRQLYMMQHMGIDSGKIPE